MLTICVLFSLLISRLTHVRSRPTIIPNSRSTPTNPTSIRGPTIDDNDDDDVHVPHSKRSPNATTRQSSLADHIEKARALKGVIVEHGVIKREVGFLRQSVERRLGVMN